MSEETEAGLGLAFVVGGSIAFAVLCPLVYAAGALVTAVAVAVTGWANLPMTSIWWPAVPICGLGWWYAVPYAAWAMCTER